MAVKAGMQGAFFAAGVDKGAPTGAGSLCEHTTKLRTLSLCELYKQRRALAVESKSPAAGTMLCW